MFQKKRLFSLLLPLFLAGVCVFLFLILLNGAKNISGLKKLYWLQADTSNISGAKHSVSRWTFYRLCGVQGGSNSGCTKASAGYPISPQDNFGKNAGYPSSFSSSRKTYFYLSKFAYAFYLIGLFFAIWAFLLSLLAVCGGTIIGSLLLSLILLTLIFVILPSALITALVVKAKHAFQNGGHSAHVGRKLMAFTWTSVFLLLLCTLFAIWHLCMFGIRSRRKSNASSQDEYSAASPYSEERDLKRSSSFRRANRDSGRQPGRMPSSMRYDFGGYYNPNTQGTQGAGYGGAAGAPGTGGTQDQTHSTGLNKLNNEGSAANPNYDTQGTATEAGGVGNAGTYGSSYPENNTSYPQGNYNDGAQANTEPPKRATRKLLFFSMRDKDNYRASET